MHGPHRPLKFLLVDQARRLPGFRSAPPSTYREGMKSQTLLLPHVSRPVRGQDSPVATPGSSWPVPSNYALFLKTIADAVQRLDHIEIVVAGLELLAQPLDVAVDGPVVDIDLIIIGRIHQRVAAFDNAGTAGQRLQNEKFGDGERHRLVLPGAGVALRVHAKKPAL